MSQVCAYIDKRIIGYGNRKHVVVNHLNFKVAVNITVVVDRFFYVARLTVKSVK